MFEVKEGLGFVLNVMSSAQLAYALKTGFRLGLFEQMSTGERTVDELADASNLSAYRARALANFLASHGVLQKNADCYSLPKEFKPYLTKGSDQNVTSCLDFLTAPFVLDAHANLSATLTDGLETDTTEANHQVWELYADSMGPIVRNTCRQIASYVSPQLQGGSTRVLDVSASHGYYGIEIAQQASSARITALDWENVLAKTASNVKAAGLQDRFDYMAGSAFDVDFGQQFDLILLPAFLHHFGPADCQQMVEKTFSALKPGGRLMVIDYMSDNEGVGTIPASFDLLMAATTSQGSVYKVSEIEHMLQNAGFGQVRHVPDLKIDQQAVEGFR